MYKKNLWTCNIQKHSKFGLEFRETNVISPHTCIRITYIRIQFKNVCKCYKI